MWLPWTLWPWARGELSAAPHSEPRAEERDGTTFQEPVADRGVAGGVSEASAKPVHPQTFPGLPSAQSTDSALT